MTAKVGGFVEQQPGGRPNTEQGTLGRYDLLAELSRGELTTVSLARQSGESGFHRLVAIKRLKPLFERQAEYAQLLFDEARIGSGLHHANVAGAVDMGRVDAACYVVMDYVEGDNLQSLLWRAGAEQHARYIAPLFVDALSGLHAAHTALADDGTPLHVVHQAPRARHILVGIDGIARIADFSQALSANVRESRARTERLQVGYMAPEQVLDPTTITSRADIFVLGIALWESLTGQPLFASESEEQTFQRLLHRRVLPPSQVGRRAPDCFDAICLKALERDPDKRYETASDMARDLRDTAINHALLATTSEIGQWVRALCGRELSERRKLVGGESGSLSAPLPGAPATEGSSDSGFFESRRRMPPPSPPASKFDDEQTASHGAPIKVATLKGQPSVEVDPGEDDPTGEHVPQPGPHNVRTQSGPAPAGATQRGEFLDEAPTMVHDGADLRAQLEAIQKEQASPPSPPSPPSEEVLFVEDDETRDAEPGDAEDTSPGFVPSRPGGGREGGAASPGAYSQVSAEWKKRRSTGKMPAIEATDAAAKSGGERQHTPRYGVPASQVESAVMKGRPVPARTRPAGAAASAARDIKESGGQDSPRQDSAGGRMHVPEAPVGEVYAPREPQQTPIAFQPPPAPAALDGMRGSNPGGADLLSSPPPPMTAEQAARQAQMGVPSSAPQTALAQGSAAASALVRTSAPDVGAPDSGAPSALDTGSAAPRRSRKGGRGATLGTMALVAIIVMAGVVALMDFMSDDAPVVEPMEEIAVPVQPVAEQPTEVVQLPAPAVSPATPTVVQPAQEPAGEPALDVPVEAAAAAPADAPAKSAAVAAPAKGKPAPNARPVPPRAGIRPAKKPVRRPAARGPKRKPATRPAGKKGQDWRAAPDGVPDNPF